MKFECGDLFFNKMQVIEFPGTFITIGRIIAFRSHDQSIEYEYESLLDTGFPSNQEGNRRFQENSSFGQRCKVIDEESKRLLELLYG